MKKFTPTKPSPRKKRLRKAPITLDYLRKQRQRILDISAAHGARNVRVFGSVARGEAKTKSDVDFLVDMERGRSLLDLAGLVVDLQEFLGRKVDVTTPDSLHWFIHDQILEEAKPL